MKDQDLELVQSLKKRYRPEDVAELILDIHGDNFTHAEKKALKVAAQHSLKRGSYYWSSMANRFFSGNVSFDRQVKAAQALFNVTYNIDSDNIEEIERAINYLSETIHRNYGDLYKMDKATRRSLGMYKNARWYNKRFRLLLKMEKKVKRYMKNAKRNALRVVSKTSLASQLAPDMVSDVNTLCFIAYYTSRKGVRSVFTNKAQNRAFDEISDMLLKKCKDSETTNWLAIAHVLPDREVLDRISDEDKGKLLSAYWSVVTMAASILEEAWGTMHADKKKMVVSRGDDSSTWNEAAGAWNQARDGWIKLLQSLEMYDVIERMLPGKVMRVMAADVARWHQMSGGDVHPDTKVWAKLPFPWEVISGKERCSLEDVENACKKADVKLSSWLGSYDKKRKAEKFTPTPELVHGVAVSSPDLARVLRKIGVFSSKGIKDTIRDIFFKVERDEHGCALNVK